MDPSNKTLRNDPEMMNAGLLVEIPDQPTFHIIHLPVTNKDSSNTWKADLSSPNWLTLETEVMRLIADGAPTECNRSGNPLVTERRTVLSGAVLRTFPRPLDGSRAEAALPNKYRARPLHVTANRGALLGDCEAGRMEFASPANFAAFGFFGAADFKHAQFSTGRANFADAQFSGGDASFTSAQFSGGLANFKFAQFSGGYANFKYAQFSGEGANFAHAQFAGGYTSFTHAQFFGGHANFKCAQFSGGHANFKYALFSDGNTNFTNAQFSSGSATFKYAQFSGRGANFHNAQFLGEYAVFTNAQFSGLYASFLNAQFSCKSVNFRSARFSGGIVDFSGILSLSELGFTRGWQGPQDAGRIEAVSSSNASSDAETAQDYTIRLTTAEAQAAMGSLRRFDFRRARCLGPVNFSDRHFAQAANFSGAQFFDHIEFHGARLHEGVDLTETRFKFDSDRAFRLPSFTEILEELQTRANVKELPDRVRDLARKNYLVAIQRFQDRSHQAARFESAYRTLKQLTAGIGARTEEQRFFALELKARQSRTDSDVRVWEKRFAALYGAMSDYGQSLTRPFWWLVRLSAVMAVVYIALNLTAPTPAGAEPAAWPVASSQDRLATRHTRAVLAQQAGYIASRVFKLGPLVYSIEITAIPLIDPTRHHPWARALSGEGASEAAPGLHPYLFALARLIHRILALPLVFLFLLTLRRRFQIS
tara:strand:- start:50 stop:2170 length:2121 start_codon:yes stop_codon:yes gene_type:complete